MGGARWGICRRCALNRIIEGQGTLGVRAKGQVHEVRYTMATKKTVAVQFGDFNRVIHLDCTCKEISEREALLLPIRATYGDRIKPADRITLQIKDDEWQRMFIDFFFVMM